MNMAQYLLFTFFIAALYFFYHRKLLVEAWKRVNQYEYLKLHGYIPKQDDDDFWN